MWHTPSPSLPKKKKEEKKTQTVKTKTAVSIYIDGQWKVKLTLVVSGTRDLYITRQCSAPLNWW